jgi:hypothetical protein
MPCLIDPRLKSDVKLVNFEDRIGVEERFVNDERSTKWTEFTKEIDGVSYRRSFPDDKRKFWSWLVYSSNKDSFNKRMYLIRDAF